MLGLTSIKEYILAGSTALLAVALAGMVFFHMTTTALLKSELEDAQKEVGTLRVEKAQLEQEKKNLTTSLDKQNKSLQDLSDASKKASDAATQAIAKAKADAKKWEQKYSDILNGPRPEGTDCEAFALKLDQYISIRQQEDKP